MVSLGIIHDVKCISRYSIYGNYNQIRLRVLSPEQKFVTHTLSHRGKGYYFYIPHEFTFHIGETISTLKQTDNPLCFDFHQFQRAVNLEKRNVEVNHSFLTSIEGSGVELMTTTGKRLCFYL